MNSRKALHSSTTNEWYTPQKYVDAAREVMGGIDLDPCGTTTSNETVRAKIVYTESIDGLGMKWNGRVWLNPPYGRQVAKWVDKLLWEFDLGHVTEAVLLVNAVPDRKWFKRLFRFQICFVDHRIRFLRPDGTPGPSPTHGNAIVHLGGIDGGRGFMGSFDRFGTIVMSVPR